LPEILRSVNDPSHHPTGLIMAHNCGIYSLLTIPSRYLRTSKQVIHAEMQLVS